MNEEHVLELHHEARKLKEHWWSDHDEPDPPPMLVVRWRDGTPQYIDFNGVTALLVRFIAKFPQLTRKIRQHNGIPHPISALYLALEAMNDGVTLPGMEAQVPKGHPMEEIWFNVEGYAQKAGEMSENIEDKEHDFRTNPASIITESMTTYIVLTGPLGTAEWGRATSQFHKDDGGVLVWEEPYVTTSDTPMPSEAFDTLLDVMTPYVTREKLA